MTNEPIKIQDIKNNVNGFLYGCDGIGLKDFIKANKVCEIIGGAVNEAIKVIDLN